MHNKYKYLLIFFLLSAGILFASIEDENISKGNRFYQSGDFLKASGEYQKVVDNGYEGPSLYYNLGNSYYRLGKTGLAILYYEKAAKLAPGDEDIAHNLAIANGKIVDKLDILSPFFIFTWWENLLAFFTISGWTYLAYSFYILVLLSIGLYFFGKSQPIQKYSLYSAAGFMVLLIITSILLSVRMNRELNMKNGVVIEQAVNVKQSPDEKSSDAFVIHEGIKVRLEDKVNDWVRIKLRDGKVGWLQEKDIRSI
jgi:tetratricopeptide (TPR) repeat protein